MSRLNMDFDEKFDNMIQTLKEDTGITQTTELIRFLIRKEAKTIEKQKNS